MPPLYLIQTDTTVGFASQDAERLEAVKGRPAGKAFLQTLGSFKELSESCRVQKKMRKRVRRAKRTTFVCGDGIARRVVSEGNYHDFLMRFGWSYSTSANPSGASFDLKWAAQAVDVMVCEPNGFVEAGASSIFRLSKTRVKKLR